MKQRRTEQGPVCEGARAPATVPGAVRLEGRPVDRLPDLLPSLKFHAQERCWCCSKQRYRLKVVSSHVTKVQICLHDTAYYSQGLHMSRTAM